MAKVCHEMMCVSGQRDKGDLWCKWAQRNHHYHSNIHLWSHHEEVSVCVVFCSQSTSQYNKNNTI